LSELCDHVLVCEHALFPNRVLTRASVQPADADKVFAQFFVIGVLGHVRGFELCIEDRDIEAIDLNISAPVITESLLRRIRSREENNFTDRMLAIMRNEFGGHAVKKE